MLRKQIQRTSAFHHTSVRLLSVPYPPARLPIEPFEVMSTLIPRRLLIVGVTLGLLKKRRWIAMAVLAAAPGHAAVAIDGSARIDLYVVASIGEERRVGYQIDTDQSDTTFVSDPTSLTASASAQVADGNRSASLAVDARADFLSADHGTFDLNSLSSVSQPASATSSDSSKTNLPVTAFNYAFTASVDAILTLTGTGSFFSDDPTFTQTRFFFSVQEGSFGGAQTDFAYASGQTLTRTYDLKAGAHYVVLLTPTAGDGYRDGVFDRLILKTNHFAFDIAAAPPAPPGTAVPEPKTWAMLMLGLAMIGGIVRRSRCADATTARMPASLISHRD